MFCKVCGFRVRVWGAYRTPDVSGTGMEVLQKSQKFRVLWNGGTEPTKVPGGYKTCCTRTLDTVMGRTKRTEIPGAGMKALAEFQKFRVLWHGRTELTEVPVKV